MGCRMGCTFSQAHGTGLQGSRLHGCCRLLLLLAGPELLQSLLPVPNLSTWSKISQVKYQVTAVCYPIGVVCLVDTHYVPLLDK